jgi:hypothetical protein
MSTYARLSESNSPRLLSQLCPQIRAMTLRGWAYPRPRAPPQVVTSRLIGRIKARIYILDTLSRLARVRVSRSRTKEPHSYEASNKLTPNNAGRSLVNDRCASPCACSMSMNTSALGSCSID